MVSRREGARSPGRARWEGVSAAKMNLNWSQLRLDSDAALLSSQKAASKEAGRSEHEIQRGDRGATCEQVAHARTRERAVRGGREERKDDAARATHADARLVGITRFARGDSAVGDRVVGDTAELANHEQVRYDIDVEVEDLAAYM